MRVQPRTSDLPDRVETGFTRPAAFSLRESNVALETLTWRVTTGGESIPGETPKTARRADAGGASDAADDDSWRRRMSGGDAR